MSDVSCGIPLNKFKQQATEQSDTDTIFSGKCDIDDMDAFSDKGESRAVRVALKK